jgi:hypothetical protein
VCGNGKRKYKKRSLMNMADREKKTAMAAQV